MEGGSSYCAARNKDGLKLCHGSERASSSDLNGDIEEFCFRSLGLVFVGDRPSRRLRGGSKLAAEGEAIEFDDGSIRVVNKSMTHGSHFKDRFDDGIRVTGFEDFFGYRKPPILHEGKHIASSGR